MTLCAIFHCCWLVQRLWISRTTIEIANLWCDNLALSSSLGSDGVTLSARFEAMAEVNIRAAGPFLCTEQRLGP